MSKILKAMEKARRERELPVEPIAERRREEAPIGGSSLRLEVFRPEPELPTEPEISVDEDLSIPDEPVEPAAVVVKRRNRPPAPDREIAGGHFGPLDEHLVAFLDQDAMQSEQYRALRHSIEQIRDGLPTVVAVTSPAPGDGKTITALNLAGALADGEEVPVLLLDLDLRHPSVATYLNMANPAKGLSDAVSGGGLGLAEVTVAHPEYNLWIVPPGSTELAPHELLKSPQMESLLQEARRRHDYVVIDAPPLLPYLDCRVIEQYVDGFLVVVAADRTPRELVGEALTTLDPSKIFGLVLNRERGRPLTYSAGSGYGGTKDRTTPRRNRIRRL